MLSLMWKLWGTRQLVVLLCLASPLGIARAQASWLSGLTQIRLSVRLEAKSAIPIPVDTAVMMRAIQNGLRAHGWIVADDPITISKDAQLVWPLFSIQLLIGQYRVNGSTSVYIVRYDYGLFEPAVPTRTPNGTPLVSRIWGGETITDVDKDIAAINPAILRSVTKIIDRLNSARGPIGRRA